MQLVTIPEITERLQNLPADELSEVYDFVCFLLERKKEEEGRGELPSEAFQLMLASESVLRRDWDRPEEAAAWEKL